MPPKRCPKCGAIQQWTLWQRCFCGYDFGPPAPQESESPPASALLTRLARPRFVEARFIIAAAVQLAAVAVAIFAEPLLGPAIAAFGAAIAPSVVRLKPVRRQVIEAVWAVAGVLLFVVVVGYLDPISRASAAERERHWIILTVVWAACVLLSLPKQRRKVLADLAAHVRSLTERAPGSRRL